MTAMAVVAEMDPEQSKTSLLRLWVVVLHDDDVTQDDDVTHNDDNCAVAAALGDGSINIDESQ